MHINWENCFELTEYPFYGTVVTKKGGVLYEIKDSDYMGEQMDATLFMTKFALEALGIKGFSPV